MTLLDQIETPCPTDSSLGTMPDSFKFIQEQHLSP